MSTASQETIQVRRRPGRMGQALFVSVLVFASLLCGPQVYAQDPNTFYGSGAGSFNRGTRVSGFGFEALSGGGNEGNDNTAIGFEALYNSYTGSLNTAVGAQALFGNTFGNDNTANGAQALYSNTTGNDNTANGVQALYSNTGGYGNTASGLQALYSNITGYGNTANGFLALFYNTFGRNNTAIGDQALYGNTTGSSNIALGYSAGGNISGSNNIDIGNLGLAGDAGKIRIGTKGTQTATFIAGISGKTVASGVGVIINANGQLGTIQSSARFKEAIKPMDKASEALLALEPVTFRYKHDLDPEAIPQFGLIAEQVAKVNPNLVARDDEGKISTVRYEAVNAMLLNEFLKEHGQVQQLKATVAQQQATSAQQKKEFEARIAQQQKQIELLAAGLQKVNEQVALQKPAPRIVANQR